MQGQDKRLDNLKPFKSKWTSGKTKLVRLPEAIIPEVLEIAHLIDQGFSVTSEVSQVKPAEAAAILQRVYSYPGNQGNRMKKALIPLANKLGCTVTSSSGNGWNVTVTSEELEKS